MVIGHERSRLLEIFDGFLQVPLLALGLARKRQAAGGIDGVRRAAQAPPAMLQPPLPVPPGRPDEASHIRRVALETRVVDSAGDHRGLLLQGKSLLEGAEQVFVNALDPIPHSLPARIAHPAEMLQSRPPIASPDQTLCMESSI